MLFYDIKDQLGRLLQGSPPVSSTQATQLS